MNIGIRAHDFGKLPIEQLADKISQKGFNYIQLAHGKALEGVGSDLGCLNANIARHIGSTFKRKGIEISVLGCYINLVHPDKNERRRLLDKFKEHLRYARDFGCNIVATETGSLNADLSFNHENHGEKAFDSIAESIRELVREAERFDVIVGVEGVAKYTIHTPDRMRRLLDAINSNNLQVIFDPVNFIDINNYKEQDKIINKCFELFGDKIAAVHAKDFIVQDGEIKSVPAGKGILNYELVMKFLKQRKPSIDILIEDIKEPFMEESKKFIEGIYERV